MKRLFTFYSIMIVVCCNIFAQTTQIGMTLAYNEKNQKTPLGGVRLIIRDASTTISDPSGKFTLRFNVSKPGDKVTYREITKDGYEIFNKDALEQWNISRNTEPFNIILCQSSKFKAIKDNYNKIASASYARQFKKEKDIIESNLKNGKIKEEEYRKKILEVEDNYYRQLDNLDNYIDRFSRIDLSELSEKENEIIELIQHGNIDEAILLYEKQDYLGKFQEESKKISTLNDAKEKLNARIDEVKNGRDSVLAAIKKQVMTYQLAGGSINIAKAKSLLVSVVEADTTNSESILLLGDFLYEQDSYEEAIVYYQLCYRHSDSNEQRMQIYYKIGSMIANNVNDTGILFTWAMSFYNGAIEEYNNLTENQRSAYVDFKIKLLHEISNLYVSSKKYPEAINIIEALITFYTENMQIYDQLGVCRCKLRLSQIYLSQNEFKKYETIMFNECLPQLEKLYNQDKSINGYYYAAALSSIANYFEMIKDKFNYLKYADMEKGVVNELYKIEPKKYLYSLSASYSCEGNSHLADNNIQEATRSFQKSYELIREDETFSFIANGIMRSSIISNLLNFYLHREQYSIILDIISNEKKISECFNSIYDGIEAEALYNIGDTAKAFNLYSKIILNDSLYYKTNDNLRLNTYVKNYLQSLSYNVKDFSDKDLNIILLYQKGTEHADRRKYEDAVKYYKDLLFYKSELNPKVIQISYYNLGQIYQMDDFSGKDLDISLEYLQEALINGYLYAYNDVAWTLHLKGDCMNALPFAQKAIESFPDDANVYDTLGTIYQCLEEREKALSAFEKCLELYEKAKNQKYVNITKDKIKKLKNSV